MIAFVLKIGDRVVVTGKKHAEGAPQGAKGEVIGFGEVFTPHIGTMGLYPGVYENPIEVRIRLDNGQEHLEAVDHLRLPKKADQVTRESEIHQAQERDFYSWRSRMRRLRDLPETPFWEGDEVTCQHVSFGDAPMIITHIEYAAYVSSPFHAYMIGTCFCPSITVMTTASSLELSARGDVWKYYHGETLTFSDVAEEAAFFDLLGHTDYVKNPRTGNFVWTYEEALQAVRKGRAHALKSHRGCQNVSAVRYHDEDLGRRVAAATLGR